MCRISKETAMRASEALKSRSRAGDFAVAVAPVGGAINISTRICGRTYSRELTVNEIKKAYGVSLQSVKSALVNGHSMPGATVKIVR